MVKKFIPWNEYEGPFVVNVNGKEVAISYRAAHDIEVEVTQ